MVDRYRVLVVDGDAPSRNHLAKILSAAFSPVAAEDAVSAAEQARQYEPDLAIVDLGGAMQGLAVCDALRELPEGRSLPIIFLSEKGDGDTARKAYSAGASLLLRKPVEPTRLMRNVELTLVRSGPPKSKQHPLDDGALGCASKHPTPVPDEEAPVTVEPPKPSPFQEPERSDVFIERSKDAPCEKPAERHWTNAEELLIPRIMIVDDDPDTIELVELALQNDYELLAALDGLQALERIYEYEPDMVILDIMMPKMNGFQLCHALRRNASFEDIPVVFLSAKSGRKDKEYAFNCGATAYMVKPFEAKQLCHMIQNIVSKPEFRVRPKRFSYRDVYRRERELMREKEEVLQMRERRARIEMMKDFIRKNG